MRAGLWIGVGLLLAAGWGAVAVQDATEGTASPTAGGPPSAEASSQRPLDPEGPWTLGAYQVRVSAAGEELSLLAPLEAEVVDGPIDRVVLRGPSGHPLAGIGCLSGSCELRTPLGVRSIPAATLSMAGPWHSGRPTGLTLDAADGNTRLSLDAFGEHGVRLDGSVLDHPVTVTSTLVLEGNPRDVDRLALRGPAGAPLVIVEPGGDGPGSVTVAGERWTAPDARVQLVGDPLTDDEVILRLHLQGDRFGLVLRQTPAEAYGRAGDALADHLILRSPTRARGTHVTLSAGPVTLAGNGTLSPHYEARTTVRIANTSGADRGWIVVDERPLARLSLSGRDGDQRVLHGTLPAGILDTGRHEVWIRLERDLAPGVVQTQRTPVIRIHADDAGPPAPPRPRIVGGALTWAPTPDAERYEAQARPHGASYRALDTNGTRARLPSAPAGSWEGRVRAVDPVGNAGPWSPPTGFTVGPPSEEDDAGATRLSITFPTDGAVVQGASSIRWRGEAIAYVEASLGSIGEEGWQRIGRAERSPMTWDSRTVPDGEYRLEVTAHGPGGPASQLVPVQVDNLAAVTEDPRSAFMSPTDRGPVSSLPGPMPGHPLPTALAFGLAAAGVVGFALVRGGPLGRKGND